LKKLFKGILIIIGIAIVLFLLIQLVPYGRNHTNPAAVNPVAWNNAQAEAIARRACYDCHSNETVWPWYSNIAPGSWLIQIDVDRGRRRLNFSDWNGRRSGEFAEVIQGGEMPPIQYIILHPNAILNQSEKDILIQAVQSLP
jgi:hypothetical protein